LSNPLRTPIQLWKAEIEGEEQLTKVYEASLEIIRDPETRAIIQELIENQRKRISILKKYMTRLEVIERHAYPQSGVE